MATEEKKPVEAPKVEKPAATKAQAKKAVKAVATINGGDDNRDEKGKSIGHSVGTAFIPKTEDERAQLFALGAVVDLNEAEEALFVKLGEGADIDPSDDSSVIG